MTRLNRTTNRGTLYIISAPSGTGKGTIIKEILNSDPTIYFSVSATTRSPRESEIDGVNYLYITRDEFMNLVENDGMLEYAEFCENFYGTPKKPVFDAIEQGRDVILEIETVGAMKVMKACPEAVSIFILPPSLAELRRRLETRGTESEEVIAKRVAEAKREIENAPNYEYVIINDDLEEAINETKAVMSAAKRMKKLNLDTIKGVLEKC